MPFRDYVGTDFVPYLLPIIPYGAPLSPKTKQLTPEKIGKIPGRRLSDGWVGFPHWQTHTSSDEVLVPYAGWYHDQPCETIGTLGNDLIGADSDFDNPAVRDLVIEEYGKMFGVAPIRTRPNSFKILIPLRLAKGSRPVTKIRRTYQDAWGTKGALEILGRGEQWVMEGMHPSGVQLEWQMGITPLVFGWDNIPEATYEQVHEFVAAVDDRLVTLGFTPIKISLHGGSAPGIGHKIGPDHPELCPDLNMLRDVLKILPCDHPEWDLYDDWMRAVAAIKTACGGVEDFYAETFEPWASEVPDNLSEDGFIRAKWDSFTETSIGWLWLCQIAHGYGYFGDVVGAGGFEVLPLEPGKSDGPSISLNRALEQELVNRFAEEHGYGSHVYVPTDKSGSFKRCESGIWIPDHTILHDISEMCKAEAERIVSRADASAAALKRAETLRGVRTAENIKRSLAGHPSMVALPPQFDNHDLIFGVPGGYVDAEGKLRDPDPKLLLTKCMLIRPDGSRVPKRFIAQLQRLTNYDDDVLECLRLALGYTLTGTAREQAFFFLYGALGGEGKTQLLELISLIMGAYAKHAEIETFMDVRGYRRSFDINDLQGYWFVYGSEADAGHHWHETRLKTWTGGELISAEGKFQHNRDFRNRSALWFAGNHKPRFRDVDGAIRRRLFIFECEIPVPKDTDIRRFSEILLCEEGSAILAWLLDARADYLSRGLYLPARMVASRNAYFDMQDRILNFAQERCNFGPDLMVKRDRFYQAYRPWCIESGMQPESKPEFYRRLEQHVGLRNLGVELRVKRLEPGRQHHPERVVTGLELKLFDDADA